MDAADEQRAGAPPRASARRRCAWLAVLLAAGAVLVLGAAPAHAARLNLGWAPATVPVDVVAGTAQYVPTLGCGSGACRAETTTAVTVTAVGGATFTDAPGTTSAWVTGAGVTRGSCAVANATTVTCQLTGAPGMSISDRSTFLRAETPFALSVPGTIAPLAPVLEATWTDSVQVGTNNPADDTLAVVRNGATDWQAFAPTLGVSTAKTVLPPLRFTCGSAECGVTPTSPFRVDAAGATTFTDPIGSTFPFGSGAFAGLCTVQSATALRCASEFPAFAPGGTPIDLTRLGFDAGGAAIGAQLATAQAPADDDAANNTMELVLQAPGPADNGDWAAAPSRIWISATEAEAPQPSFECLTPLCETAPSTGFRIDAVAGATFTASVGSTFPFGTSPLTGTCTVASATAVLCAPAAAIEVTQGTLVALPRLDISLPAGASPGTTFLQAGLIGQDANDANDTAAFVAYAPGMLISRLAFFEGFEHGQANLAVPLANYVGAAPWGETYTADPAWLANCNGTIQSWNLTEATLPTCPSVPTVGGLRELSWALGAFDSGFDGGVDPFDNHALGSYTSGSVPAGQTLVLANVGGFDVTPGHYYAASFDYAAFSCTSPGASAARYTVSLGAPGGPATALNDGVIDPCLLYQDANHAGRYVSDGDFRASGSKLALRIANLETSGVGNDSAIDNLAVYDVSPTLEKSFSPSSDLAAGQRSRLTFTITNSEERGAKAGWKIDDALPAGLLVASDPAVSSNCESSSVTAAPGARTIAAVGSLADGSSGCEIGVWVVAPAAGTFSNCAANLAASSGLILPTACAQVTYSAGATTRRPATEAATIAASTTRAPSASPPPAKKLKHRKRHGHGKAKHGKPVLAIRKTASTRFARPTSVLAYTITVRNEGNRAARKVKVCDVPPSGLTILRSKPAAARKGSSCWRLRSLAAGGKRVFRLTARIGAGVGGAVVRNVATVSAANVGRARTDSANVRVEPLPGSACGSRLLRPLGPRLALRC